MGKRVIVTYQGCDLRLCESCPVRNALSAGEKCINVPPKFTYREFDKIKLRRLDIWLRHADAVLGITPDLCRLDGVRYTPHAKFVDPDVLSLPKLEPGANSRIRIAHPPKTQIKGSRWIQREIQKLSDKYPGTIEFVPIIGLPWRECLKTLATCDIVIDQVLFGWYGGISVEAALLNVLPIAYVDPELLRFVPDEMRNDLPVLPLEDKRQLLPVLEDLIRNRNRIHHEAGRCHRSAMKFHEATAVSKQIIEQYYLKKA